MSSKQTLNELRDQLLLICAYDEDVTIEVTAGELLAVVEGLLDVDVILDMLPDDAEF